MEANESICQQVLAKFSADSGSGGLAEAGGVAFVRSLYRKGDSQDRSSNNWPQVEVDVASVDRSPSFAATSVYELFDTTVTFTITSDRDQTPGFAPLNRVESRIRAVFNGVRLSSLADTDDAARTWSFAPMGRMSPRRGEPNGKELHLACPYRLVATKGVT